MRNQGQLFIGALLVLIGLMFLLGNLFGVNVWALCGPLGLILLGVWIVLRPHLVGSGTTTRFKLLGDIHRDGAWQVANQEIWIGVGEVDLDLTRADIPEGETKLRVFGFAGDVEVLVPEEVAVSVFSMAFVTDGKVLDRREEGILAPVHATSDDYETAGRKLRLETTFFVVDLKVRRV